MNLQINNIPIKYPLYKSITIDNLKVQKIIYPDGQISEVKFVLLQQIDPQSPTLDPSIKIKYALKVISKSKISTHSEDYQKQYNSIYNQIVALYLLDHPNIVKLYWHQQDINNIYLLMEYAGTKFLNYSRKNKLNQQQIKSLFKQICEGVQQIHNKNIMHRDLCLDNISISTANNNLIKILDFDHAIQYLGGRQSAQGLLSSMAPEVYQQKKYNHKADIWSLGVILYQLFHKRNPFVDQTEQYTEQQFVQKRDSLQYQITNLLITTQAKQLIHKMLSLNPDKRPTVQQILSSKWITGKSQQLIQHIQNEHQAHQNVSSDDKKTMQMANNNLKDRKSLSAFSISDKGQNKFKIGESANNIDRSRSDKVDDFVFDKIINKMTIENSVQQLQKRLRCLLKIRAEQLVKKRQLTLKYIEVQKSKIHQQMNK